MNATAITNALASILPLTAAIAVVVILLKVLRFAPPAIPGSTTDWLYLAIACAAAKMAR